MYEMFFLSISMLIFGCIAFKKNKGIDLISLFCFIWTIVFGAASLKLFGMREYQSTTVALFALASFSFFIFGYIGRYGKYKHFRLERKTNNKEIKLNKWILWILICISTAFILYMMLRMLALMQAGIPMGTIHAMYLGRGNEDFFTIPILNQLHSKLIIPFVYCLVPIIVYLILTDLKGNWLCILVGLADLLLYMMATGSRIVIIFVVSDMLLMLSFTRIRLSKKAFRKIKKFGSLILVFLIIALIGFTISRKGFASNNGKSVVSQVFGEIYKYFSLCIPFSDYWLSSIDKEGIVTYGKLSFYGALSLIEWICVFFFKTNTFGELEICKEIASNLEIMRPIFKDAKCNAFVTYLFYFYTDFGIVGVMVLSSIWGFLCGNIGRKIKKERTERSVLFYLLFAQTVSMSFSRWSFFDAPYFLAFLYMSLLFAKGKNKKKRGYKLA